MLESLSFWRRSLWGTLSKALARSNKATTKSLRASMSLCQSKKAVRRASVVDDFGKNPNCFSVSISYVPAGEPEGVYEYFSPESSK